MIKPFTLVAIAILLAGFGCSARRYTRDLPAPKVVPLFPVILTNGPPEFRQYDEEVARSIRDRWYDLVDTATQGSYREGTVVLNFHLHDDGRVTRMSVLENSAGIRSAWLCQKAVMDIQPFLPLPSELRGLIKTNSRSITFSFSYYGEITPNEAPLTKYSVRGRDKTP
jgi:hypothetical protein